MRKLIFSEAYDFPLKVMSIEVVKNIAIWKSIKSTKKNDKVRQSLSQKQQDFIECWLEKPGKKLKYFCFTL